MPRLLREIIVSSLSPHQDFQVIEVEEPELQELARLGSGGPAPVDVLVLGSAGAELTAGQERWLRGHPEMRILAIDSDGRHAALYELRLQRVALREITTERLGDAIRAACSPHPTPAPEASSDA